MPQKPNFFIVGMARAGTTSLWQYLRTHPQVFMSQQKEPGFFDKDIDFLSPNVLVELEKRGLNNPNFTDIKKRKRYQLDEKNYLSLFNTKKKCKVFGEASVSYITSKTAGKEIYQFNPKAKILISLRNFTDVLLSRYFLFHNLGIFKGTLKEHLNSEFLIKDLQRIPENICYFQEKFQCKIIFFEDFKKENEEIYKDILKFLKVDSDILPDLKTHNSSKSVKNYSILHKMLDNRILLKIRLLFSPNNLNLSETINKFLGGYRKRESLPIEIKEQLRNTFLPTIKEVEKITNRNLSHWY